jgi:parallel beta-helix repeat protein
MKRIILIFVSVFSIVFASQATNYVVTTPADAGAGSLRVALATAAGDPAVPHVISFSTAMIITINSDLSINDGNHVGLTINGFVDATAGPDVTIRGNGTLNNKIFLNSASGVKIHGLVFDNMDYGIQMNNSTTCEVKGCYFGSNLAGTAVGTGIQHAGIFLNSSSNNNIIGGTATISSGGVNNPERCLFVKCMQVLNTSSTTGGDLVRYGAILIDGSGTNQITNNYFGTDITGLVKLTNGTQATKLPLDHHNILIRNASSNNNTIDRNLIAGVTGCGIYIENGPSGTVIKGNIIGLNASSTTKFPNEACGIYMENISNAVIGGATSIERNIISGNGGAAHNSYDDVCHYAWNDFNQYGIYAKNINGCTFKGNYIGTDASGNSSGTSNILGNRAGGIKIVTQEDGGGSSNNIIGGANTGEGNVISGNGYNVGASVPNATCNFGNPSLSGITGGPGITLQYGTCSFNTILGNNIGLGADGTTALGNSQEGISILGAANNTIGGNTVGAANYIANNSWGIMMQVDFACHWVQATNSCNNTLVKAATGNIVIGNSIGINRSGGAAGNGNRTGDNEGGGICLQMGATGNYIGRNNTGEGNVIASNRVGIVFRDADDGKYAKGAAKNNFVYNNIIGDPTGGTLGNKLTPAQTIYGHGILMQVGTIGTTFPSGNIIGGTGANQKNYISGNQQSGILLHHTAAITVTTANSIVGNYIGTTVSGTSDAGNTNNGIEIVNVSRTTITSNLISGNDQNGISLTGSSANTIQNNTIGSNATRTAAIPNTLNGISVTAASANNIIGGIITATEPNFIFNNGANGIVVDGSGSNNNSIHQNLFSCNTLRGIVLTNNANAGIKTATILGSPTQLTYTNPNAFAAWIEIFETDGCATCPNDGTRLQGAQRVVSGNIAANGTFAFTTALTFSPSKLYTAILHQGSNITTTAARNTSEFTACYVLCSNPTPGITGTTTLCEGTTGATFAVSPVTTGSTYSWTVPTGITVTAGAATSSITVTVGTGITTANISVLETVVGGCTGTGNATLTIKTKPTLVSAGTTQNLCSATTANLTGSALPPGTTGAWSVSPSGPTFTNGTSASATANGLVPGTNYTFTWSVTNAPCAAVTAPLTVNNPIKPTPSITGITTLCEGTTGATFSTASVSGNTYAWTVPTNVTITAGGTTSSVTTTIGTAPITGSISVTESSSATCFTTIGVPLTIKAKPGIVSAGGPQSLCSATTVNLTGTATSGTTTGAWSVLPSGPTFTSSTSASTTANGLVPGTNYTFTWALTNAPCAAVSGTAVITNSIKPTPSVTGTTTLCEGTTGATFSTTSVSGNTYSWTAPTGVTITAGGATPSVTTSIGAAPITGDIAVTESSSPTCNTTATATLTIKSIPTGLSAGTDRTLCAATTVALTGSPLNGTTGLWTVSPSAGVTFDDATSPTTNANGLAGATDYTFTWSVTNAPCAAVNSKVVITNKPEPTVSNAGASQQTCNTANVTLAGNNPAIGTGAWTVSPSAGITFDNAASPTAQASGLTAGTSYTFTWTITNAPCASSTSTVGVERTDLETPTIDGGGAHCSSLTATLTVNNSKTGSTYVWDVVDGDATITSSTTANPITVNSGSAGGVIRVRETNGGCRNIEATTSITISPNTTLADAGDPFFSCLGTAPLKGNIPSVGTGSWSVVLPSTAVVTAGTTQEVADASGLVDGNLYKFVYTVTGICSIERDTVEVKAGLDNLFITADGPSDTLCVRTNRSLSASASGGSNNFSYVWVSSDGSFSLTSPNGNITVQPSSGGETIYTVYAIDNSNPGCETAAAQVKVNAVEGQDLNIPNLITPNGDNKNDVFVLKDKVTGMPILKEGSHIEVVNRWGSRVYEAKNYENNWVPNDLTDGMYYYRVTSTCGNKEYKSWLQILGNTNN